MKDENEIEKIKDIAKKIRKAFEEIERKEDYSEASLWGFDLGGYCGRAAIQLYLACKKSGIKIKIIEGIGHAYNEYNGHIIDITATQFGKYPKVHIRKYKCKPHYIPEFYQKVRTHLSTKSLADAFWIPQHLIDRDKEVVLKYIPRKTTGGQRRKLNVKTKCKSKKNN